MTAWIPCPDFDLGPLKSFDPKIFNWESKNKNRRDVYAFVITLALIYNDFKDLSWWSKQLNDHPPQSNELSAYLGQHNGMKNHISRLVLGLYHELLKLIERHREMLGSDEFKELLGRLSARDRTDWKKLVNESLDKELLNDLEDLRANGVFHYLARGIFAGYENTFKNPRDPLQEKAWFSPGEKILKTRFYFADAAVIGYSYKFGEKRINYLLDELNVALKSIVEVGIDCFKSKYSVSG